MKIVFILLFHLPQEEQANHHIYRFLQELSQRFVQVIIHELNPPFILQKGHCFCN